ncbi:MAG: 2-polyprenyl-3-methyl-6-methoxy-1,4-benzoquinone monooxygenase [Burkholderiales bacterium]|jgi:ubiquinone biosynthesis monooxygenase Coq7|nr:2-polyprenyl-3-methyl-6-methoxy-1,4-benzoquinone monooxygenase [Betaproteobacteria bacterium]
MNIDAFISTLDNALRTLAAPAHSRRPIPGEDLPEAELDAAQRLEVARLMRVNHVGEVCAQALYAGQALTARDSRVQAAMREAAQEETEHLAWTAQRIGELGGRTSLLNPVWYAGSFAMGALAGALGDRVNLGFLAETERQVYDHLEEHLGRLPAQDAKSAAILKQMQDDEDHHRQTAIKGGGVELPSPVQEAMRLVSKVMTRTAYWV